MEWKKQLHYNIAQLLALIPTSIGMLLRRAYYKFSLKECGSKLVVEYLTIITTRTAKIGNNVWIGPYSLIGNAMIGDGVMIASHCVVLSQSEGHKGGNRNVKTTQTKIGNNVWIGSHCTIRNHVSDNTIVGANSMVAKQFEPNLVIAGCPAIVLKTNPSQNST